MATIRFIYTLAAGLLLNTAGIAQAQSNLELPTDSTAMYLELDEFVVYGSPLMKEVIPVQKLSGEQLKNLSSFSVADAIRYFSGVQLKDYGGIGGL